MNAPINDGGPAFPVPPERINVNPNGDVHWNYPNSGMTLRDWFAGQALVGWTSSQCSIEGQPLDGSDKHAARIAQTAYRYADAMLAARERKEDGK